MFSFSLGSVSTLFRWGGNFCHVYIKYFFLLTIVQKYKKSIKIFQSYDHKCSATFFMVHSVQAAVHGRFVFLQLQLRLLHYVVQLHVISSMTDSGVDGRDEKLVQEHHFQFSIPLSLLEVVQDTACQPVGLSTLMLGSVPAWRERIGHRVLG